ncbi:hypothetical protein DB31_4103 [Hyalangium minutum]|uniref:Uncharacterized protein n=1 Tax=Hyalangium minutum TaxID=394096 RepID=A0A085W3Y0_9BACT|nr:hypothetical protein DB31_4103 [Hyalangium minutum]
MSLPSLVRPDVTQTRLDFGLDHRLTSSFKMKAPAPSL